MLGPIADAKLGTYERQELDRFEQLMEEADTDLLKWLMGQEPTPADADHEMLADILVTSGLPNDRPARRSHHRQRARRDAAWSPLHAWSRRG